MVIVALDAVAALLVLGFWLVPNPARFTVDTQVERFTLTVPPGTRPPSWGEIPLDASGDLLAGCDRPRLALKTQYARPLLLVFSRAGEALTVAFTSDGEPLGTLACGDTAPVVAGDYAVGRWPAEAKPTLALAGALALGDELAANGQSANLLREGHIDVEARSWPFTSGMARATTPLILGDQIQIFADDADPPHPALVRGLVRPDGDAMRVVAYATAQTAQVMRAGQSRSTPIVIAPTFLARLQSQAEWAIVAVLATLLLSALTAMAKILELANGARRDDD